MYTIYITCVWVSYSCRDEYNMILLRTSIFTWLMYNNIIIYYCIYDYYAGFINIHIIPLYLRSYSAFIYCVIFILWKTKPIRIRQKFDKYHQINLVLIKISDLLNWSLLYGNIIVLLYLYIIYLIYLRVA